MAEAKLRLKAIVENIDDLPEDKRNIAEIIIAKQRNGPTDTIKLAFLKQFTRFEDAFIP